MNEGDDGDKIEKMFVHKKMKKQQRINKQEVNKLLEKDRKSRWLKIKNKRRNRTRRNKEEFEV